MSHHLPVLIISGPVGVGKTSVASEVSEVLIPRSIPHTFIDLDQLRYTYPRAADDRFGSRLGLQNLASVWANCAAAGSRNLILASVIEDQANAMEIGAVIPQAQVSVYQLWAKPASLEKRVRQREFGAGLDWHLARSLELAEQLPHQAPTDREIWTDDRSISNIAAEIANDFAWVKS